MGFIYFTGANLLLTMVAAVLCVCFAPTAAGPGIPEIKAYLNGVDTPNMFGATTLIVKNSLTPSMKMAGWATAGFLVDMSLRGNWYQLSFQIPDLTFAFLAGHDGLDMTQELADTVDEDGRLEQTL
nr:chloride channel protein clc-b [Quercus suber]